MKRYARSTVPIFILFMIVLPTYLQAEAGSSGDAGSADIRTLASPANLQQFFRDRYQIPDSTQVNAQPMQRSRVPHFYQTVVTVNDGKQPRAFNAFLTDDARCLAIGAAFALNGTTEAEIIQCIRQAASLPFNARITVGTFARTRLVGFLRSTVSVALGGKTEKGDLFLSPDRRAGVLGLMLPYRHDFVEQLINLQNQPSMGAAHPPVTIVEYADLECPGCAMMQKFLEAEFLPKYGSRVRVVLKEYPLAYHPWSTTGALANECAYQINPAAYFAYRTLIFGSQDAITAANVRDRLLSLGQDAGLSRVRLAGCLDSEASLGRIQASRAEGELLGIGGTPTFVINGRVFWGAPAPAVFEKMVDGALAAAGK